VSLTPPFLLLDRYDVSAQIGRGGHAVVYRAHDRVFDRAVAIKLLRDDALSPDVLARFRQEIQLTARLEHAHILHVYDTGTFEGLPFVVMELASGQTLADRLAREGPLPVADALQITRDVGLALAHAHARGIVHRDVKPENILLGSGGAMLADFGVARVTADQSVRRLTSTGMAVGTLQYMSPEQLCAEPQIDHRSDQYALACVLYEMLAGVRPHASASLEGLRMLRLTGQQAPVSAHRPSVPAEVEDALQVAMAVAPADRFRDVEALLAALGVAHTGDLAVPGGTGSGARRSGARSGQGMTPVAGAPAVRETARRRWGFGLGLMGLATAALIWRGVSAENRDELAIGVPNAGTLTVALAPVAEGADSLEYEFRARVRDELNAWPELRVTDRDGRLQAVTRVTRLGDSIQLRLDVAPSGGAPDPTPDIAATARLSHRVVRMSGSAAPSRWGAMIPSMVREALSGHSLDQTPGLERMPGRSLALLRSYVSGFEQLRLGEIDSAARAFRKARTVEPEFALAHFWASQSEAWNAPRKQGNWQLDAEEAFLRRGALGEDSLLAIGLVMLARRDYPEACASFRLATKQLPRSFVAWYGLASCLQLDPIVVSNGGTLQFRSSAWAAIQAYRVAIEHAPSAEWLGATFGPVLRSTFAGGIEVRVGEGESKHQRFYAFPGLSADTLVFSPVDSVRFVSGAVGTIPTSSDAAVRRGRAVALELTERWIVRFPEAPVAWYFRAVALEMSGAISRRDAPSAESALDSVEKRAASPLLRSRARIVRIRLAMRRGSLDSALHMAQDLLADTSARGATNAAALAILSPIAAFAGDRRHLLEYLETGENLRPAVVRAPLRDVSVAILTGDCQRVRADFRRLDSAVNSAYARAQARAERAAVLVPVLRLAVPCLGPEPLTEFNPTSAPLDSVHLALARGDRSGALAQLSALRTRRSGAITAAISWDYLYAEAWATRAAGDTAGAMRQILAGLDGLASMNRYTLDVVEHAAGIRLAIRMLGDFVRTAKHPLSDTIAPVWQSAAQWLDRGASQFSRGDQPQ
jgi:tRNA A-37 threonylcarbamoyl transferase component Bud32/tetratricopeptide (TPR) repeat protein